MALFQNSENLVKSLSGLERKNSLSCRIDAPLKNTLVSPTSTDLSEINGAWRSIVAKINSATVQSKSPTSLPSPAVIDNKLKQSLNGKSIDTPSGFLDTNFLRRLWGHASEFKEGDTAINVAAQSDTERQLARDVLSQLKLGDINASLFVEDEVSELLESSLDHGVAAHIADWKFSQLKEFLLTSPQSEIKEIMPGLRSEVIAGVVKLMSNDELTKVASKIYNNLPGLTLGADGYFSSRIQPNSPTDDPLEVLFSVLEGLSYGCGDAIFGINIVASDMNNVQQLEEILKDVIETFKLREKTKWCVLAHIDDQLAVHDLVPGSVDAAFQSIGGTESVNKVFNISVGKLFEHLRKVNAQYFETGQGSAVTNKAACGVDMVTLEARAHGLARSLAKANGNWTIVNTVAGFIGPEVFRSPTQLLRACLEDLLMGKLHGLVFGLDICSTYHMSLEIDEMFHIQDEVMKAGPGFYMAVAGNSDPMLSYLTTSYRDHPRLRKTHGKKVTEEMKTFFVEAGVMREDGSMTSRAGDTEWMYYLYKRAKGDSRSETELRHEARETLTMLQARGLDLGYGHDGKFHAPPLVRQRHQTIYNDAKRVIWNNLSESFLQPYRAQNDIFLSTLATDRESYIIQPYLGEELDTNSQETLNRYRQELWDGLNDDAELVIQVVVSEGLNAESIALNEHLPLFMKGINETFGTVKKVNVAKKRIFVTNGRVRSGYRVGQLLFGSVDKSSAKNRYYCILHAIGERPGNGQNTFSAYISCVNQEKWSQGVDHCDVNCVCNISKSALEPDKSAQNLKYFIEKTIGKSLEPQE